MEKSASCQVPLFIGRKAVIEEYNIKFGRKEPGYERD